MSEKLFIGVDSGANGCAAVINEAAEVVAQVRFKDATPHDIWRAFCEHFALTDKTCFAVIEFVRATPQMGVVSAFTFGCNYSQVRSFLVAGAVPFVEVTPQKWQGTLGCRTKGDKNVSKAKAQELFPSVKITHGNADALLLAWYALRTRNDNV